MVNIVDTQMGTGNCGAKESGFLATTYGIRARCKEKEERQGEGFSSICRIGFKTDEQ